MIQKTKNVVERHWIMTIIFVVAVVVAVVDDDLTLIDK